MLNKIADLLMQNYNILVLCHVSPDGDTLGSGAALVLALRSFGKKAFIGCADKIAEKYEYLAENVIAEDYSPDFVVAVDAASIKLLGALGEKYKGKIAVAIDHHISHNDFAEIDYVDANCAANCEIVYQLLKIMKTEFTKEIADAIYTGISTDSGCFRYKNVTPQTHRIAAEMIECGAESGKINQIMFETKTKEQITAEISALSSMEYFIDGKAALIAVTREMMRKTGISDTDLDPIVARPRQIKGVLIGATLKEKDGGFKISVRTNEPASASDICGKFGGGGHKAAGGCFISGELEEVKQKFKTACEEYAKEIKL